jgi:hypothetical protein
MMLGYIHTAERGVPNAVLSELAIRLAARGVHVTGLVQVRAPEDGAHPCDMDLASLPKGPRFGIAQKLGAGSRGCRMDVAALSDGVTYVAGQVAGGAEVMILNKFGSEEARGRGFCEVIADALTRGVPVVTVVNPLNLEAFLAFAGGGAEEVPADVSMLERWIAARIDR